ncbi:MAG TPA: glycosyltransferase family 39 protein [Acidimicrobiia bacterium]|nr:glycosyltransferase family 39 protein [Acidimicrobiia bacterium]
MSVDLEQLTPRERAERSIAARAFDARARWPVAVVVLATFLCAALCAYRLGAKSLWFDEGYTVGVIARPFGGFLWRLGHWDLNQAPYELLVYGWYRIDTGQEFLRSLSVAFAVATVPMVFVVGRRLLDARIGAIAAVLVAVNGFVVQWAQSLRGYSLALFLATVMTWLFLQAVERPTTARSLAYALVATVAIYAHMFCALVVVAHAVALVVRRPLPRRFLTVAGSTLVVTVLPLAVWSRTRRTDPLAWIGKAPDTNLLHALADISGGSKRPLVAYAVVGLVGLVAMAHVVRRAPRSETAWRRIVVASWLVVPVVLTLFANVLAKPLLVGRYLIMVVPALALVAAVGVCAIPWRSLSVVAMAALLAGSGFGLSIWYTHGSIEDWRGATHQVLVAQRPGDALVVAPRDATPTVTYYERRAGGPHPSQVKHDPHRAVSERLWVLERTSQRRRNPFLGFHQWRDHWYAKQRVWSFHGVRLTLYVARAG